MPQPLAVFNKLDYPRAVLRFYENTVFYMVFLQFDNTDKIVICGYSK